MRYLSLQGWQKGTQIFVTWDVCRPMFACVPKRIHKESLKFGSVVSKWLKVSSMFAPWFVKLDTQEKPGPSITQRPQVKKKGPHGPKSLDP